MGDKINMIRRFIATFPKDQRTNTVLMDAVVSVLGLSGFSFILYSKWNDNNKNNN